MMATLDEFGRPIEPSPRRLNLAERTLAVSLSDRSSVGSVLGSVTPAAILSCFTDADNGYPGRQIELAQDIRERDDHVASMDQTRRMAVAGMEFLVSPGGEETRDQEAAETFSAVWAALEPREIIDRMLSAILEQWSVQRVIWDTGAAWTPVSVEEVDARRLVWPQTATTGAPGDLSLLAPQVSVDWTTTNTEPLTPGKYLWHSYRARMGRPGKGALIRCLAVYWMFKRFSLTDMATLLEQWGRPWPGVKYDEKATTEEVRTWIERLARSMASRVIALPKGAELDVHDAAATGADAPHLHMIRACNEAISKAVIGSTTIAEAASNNDSVSSPTHAQVREDIRNADAFAVAASIRRNLIVPWTLWNYGPQVAAPQFAPNTAPKIDPQARSQVYIAARDLGLAVMSEQLYRELKLERPQTVPEVLELKATPSLPSLGGIGIGWDRGQDAGTPAPAGQRDPADDADDDPEDDAEDDPQDEDDPEDTDGEGE